jgi:hypothetical protein
MFCDAWRDPVVEKIHAECSRRKATVQFNTVVKLVKLNGALMPHQSIRLSDRVAETLREVEARSIGVDAVELPRDAGPARHARCRVI